MKNIAIIGTGIAGLSCGYYLSRHHRVTLFESGDYIGGHTHTVDIEYDGEHSAIDTGFIVFNDRTYPRFIRLLRELGVGYQPTEMSFSVRNDAIDLEYNGHDLSTLFAQRRNIINGAFMRLLLDIVRFNRSVSQVPGGGAATIGEYLDKNRFGELFAENYLLPMAAAIWSMGLGEVRSLPLQFFIRFFENHGLLDLVGRPQWYSIIGGSRSYIKPLVDRINGDIRLSSPVERVEVTAEGVMLSSGGSSEVFDEVVFACHGDQALAMIEGPSAQERQVLQAFSFTDNEVILHTDEALLPRQKRAWASWNYRVKKDSSRATLTYNMNILQRLGKKHTYLVTLNEAVPEDKVLARYSYAHPVYNNEVIAAQQLWQSISGVRGLHFCGAYWFDGFHEDGVRSGLRVCESLGVTS